MPGGRSGLYPGIEKKHQSAEHKQYEAENDLLRAVGRERLLELAQAEKDGRLMVLEPNDPLTPEQLREMDGEPVWCNVGPGQWGIVNKFVDEVVFFNGGTIPIAHLQGRAYRREPEEEPHERPAADHCR